MHELIRKLALRQYYVRSIVADVEAGDGEIRGTGHIKALERAVGNTEFDPGRLVPNFEREWRTRQDSNLWPLPSEGSALSS